MYEKSLSNPEEFWAEQAKRVDWIRPFHKVKDCSFHSPVKISWYQGGQLNVSYNCIDRHLKTRADAVALIWEPDGKDEAPRKITYRELHDSVSRLANVMKSMGVKKGDRVTIYLPMIPEAAFAMLACSRIGAIHSVVFAGFSADALADRIQDCESSFLITADEGLRGGKKIPLKRSADQALAKCPKVKNVLVVQRTKGLIPFSPGRDVWYHEAMNAASNVCPPEAMDAEDPLFILYTSGSTAKPKGVLHATGGYLVYASFTHEIVFDYRKGEVFWCTADVGWVTGHSYVVYGPLANGATSLMFEGVPNYPDFARFWETIDRHKVNIFYTAPTAIRALAKEGEQWVKPSSLASLRLLGSVGEPINPEAWLWYHDVIGQGRCAIVDTWWQTETGGILISPLPGAIAQKPGSATLPFFGVTPVLVDETGKILHGEVNGHLCLTDSWPGQMQTIYNDHKRFEETYFSTYKGYYFTGDGAKRDSDGYFWITGRVDDVLNISGHRLGTAELESALSAHSRVAECAVVGYPHDIKGHGIHVFVILKDGSDGSPELCADLVNWVRKEIGPIASPDRVQCVRQLPKTRSGKIMRRILRKIAESDLQHLGDTSTLADPSAVADIIQGAKKFNTAA
jgi:acetyl-CoA synthetase